jgi:ABC-type multidrug transport system fused ATPase/permease subunit
VVVAHRLSTVQSAQQILVLNAGRIEEQGSHAELMEKGGIYRSMVDLQAIK